MTTAVFLGTSITEGQGQSGGAAGAFPAFAGARLGWTVVNQGVGSTDYFYGAPTFRARIPNVVAAIPDVNDAVIVIEGGVSSIPELGVSLAAFTAEVPLFFAALRAALPTVPVYVLSPTKEGRVLGDILANRAVLAAAAETFHHNFIDWTYWTPGTGHVGAPTGDGNADVYVAVDMVHPSAPGHPYRGTRLAFAIRPPNTGLVGL